MTHIYVNTDRHEAAKSTEHANYFVFPISQQHGLSLQKTQLYQIIITQSALWKFPC